MKQQRMNEIQANAFLLSVNERDRDRERRWWERVREWDRDGNKHVYGMKIA